MRSNEANKMHHFLYRLNAFDRISDSLGGELAGYSREVCTMSRSFLVTASFLVDLTEVTPLSPPPPVTMSLLRETAIREYGGVRATTTVRRQGGGWGGGG